MLKRKCRFCAKHLHTRFTRAEPGCYSPSLLVGHQLVCYTAANLGSLSVVAARRASDGRRAMPGEADESARFHLGDVVGELPGVGGLGPGFEGGGVMRPTVPPAGEHPAGVPDAEHVSLRRALAYSSGNFGSGLYYGLNSFILPILLAS